MRPEQPPVDFSLILPSYRPGASREGIVAAVETAARLGWSTVWTTDHLVVPRDEKVREYAEIFEALTTLAYIGGLHPTVRLGTSVLVVPMRDALVVAKEIATIDALTGGRVELGVGVGWYRREFANLGLADRFHRRGAYVDEAIALWRYLWAGRRGPFSGRFHSFDDVEFGPLPAQGEALPIWVGGRSQAALERAGRLGDGYHQTGNGPAELAVRAPVIRGAAEAAGRAMPALGARVRVAFGPHEGPGYVFAGTPEQMLMEVRSFAAAGATSIAVDLVETDPEAHTRLLTRFHDEVVRAYHD